MIIRTLILSVLIVIVYALISINIHNKIEFCIEHPTATYERLWPLTDANCNKILNTSNYKE